MRVLAQLCLAVVTLVGCTQGAEMPQAEKPVNQGTIGQVNVIINATALRLAPSAVESVPHPQAGAAVMVDNLVGHLRRGLRCKVLNVVPGWTFVKLPDDAEGWVASSDVALAESMGEATVLQSTPAYQSNSIQSPKAAIVAPGSLLLVLEAHGPLTKVQVENAGVTWMESSKIVYDPQEVGMSHLLNEAKAHERNRDSDELIELLDEARIKYPTSPLIELIAEKVNFMRTRAVPTPSTARMNTKPTPF